MNKKIHFETIQKLFKEKYDAEPEVKLFENNKTGELYDVIFEKGVDIAFFTMRNGNEYFCIDSNGMPLDDEKVFGYVNAAYAEHDSGKIFFDADALALNYRDTAIDNHDFAELEKRLFPQRTNIILKTEKLCQKEFPVSLVNFCVDEVIYVQDSEFEIIRNGEYSDILKEYNKKNYERSDKYTNGILIINKNGDGLMVDTQGYDYARYKAYAPQVGEYIKKQQTMEMRQRANIELNLYVPLNVTRWDYECDAEESVDENDYVAEIREAVQRENRFETERGLAEYLDAGKVKEKVYKITPAVEMYNGKLLGVAKCLLTENLDAEELDNLKEYCVGQFSDGWGEGFEQREISTSDGNIYVHFWEYSNTYYIKTEEELKQDFEQGQGMQPMQGM